MKKKIYIVLVAIYCMAISQVYAQQQNEVYNNYLPKSGYSKASVTFGDITATINQKQIVVQFTTEKETDNDYFDIEISKDGKIFTKLTRLMSLHTNGNSANLTVYSTIIDQSGTKAAFVMGVLLLGLFPAGGLKRTIKFTVLCITLLVGIAFVISACSKADKELALENNPPVIRIAQVDKNGITSYSKLITVATE